MQAESRKSSAASVTLLQQLQQYEKLFKAADVNKSGSLSEADFLLAFKGHMGLRAFLAIDDNCDGRVTWEEISAQLLMDRTKSAAEDVSQGSGRKTAPTLQELDASTARQQPTATSSAAAGGPGAPASASKASSAASGSTTSRSRGQQTALSALVHADVSSLPDRWYTADMHGVVQVWNGKDLNLLRSHKTSLPAITSATLLPSSGLLALGSYNRSLLLLDPTTGRQAATLPGISASAALSLCAWSAPATAPAAAAAGLASALSTGLGGHTSGSGAGDGSSTSRSTADVCRDLLAVGDADGSVRLWQVDTDDTAGQKSGERLTTRRLWHSGHHHDWVVSVLHCPQISSVAAASLDKTISLTDLERCIAVRTLTGHTKPVHCCAWNSLLKVVASGSSDRRVLLWNPFSCRVLGALTGHTAPVVCLASNERDMQIYAASADNTVKVWDLRNQRCLQTLQLSPAVTALGGHHAPLSVMSFSPQARLLVAGAVRLQGWVLSDGGANVRVGHKEAVSWAGCVEELDEVVSTDLAGMVCCWDLLTGRLCHSFDTHGRITAAAFDANRRRLITGYEDGSIRVWNFRTGGLCTSSAGPSQSSGGSQWGTGSGVEVTGLAVASTSDTNGQASACIVATGWDRKVSWYADNGKPKCPLLRALAGPSSDVLAAAAMPGQPLLATACYDGEVWLWNLDSGTVLRKLVPPRLLAFGRDERAVEALAFMHGDLRHILLAAGADCVLRFWDCHSGSCLEHHTSHFTTADKGLCAVVVSPDNSTAVTADVTGTLTVWDISSTHSALKALTPQGMHRGRGGSAGAHGSRASAVSGTSRGAAGVSVSSSRQTSPRVYSRGSAGTPAAAQAQQAIGVRQLAAWQAHTDAVTALVWVTATGPAGAAAATQAAAVAAAHEGEGGWQQPEPVQQTTSKQSQQPITLLQQQQQQQQPMQPPQHPLQDQKQPLLHALATAEAQQQSAQFLAQIQQQKQQQHPEPLPQQQQQQQQPLAGVRPPIAAAGVDHKSSSSSSSRHSSSFILSAGLDHSMVLWSPDGAKVGVFGKDSWQLHDHSTWQQPPGSCSADAAQAVVQQQLQQQPSLDSACSLGDCGHAYDTPTCVTDAQRTPVAAAAGEATCGRDSTGGPPATLQPPQQSIQQHTQGHGSKPDAVDGDSWGQATPAAAAPKAVTFACLASPGAAAAAVAAAEAKLLQATCVHTSTAVDAAAAGQYACSRSSSSPACSLGTSWPWPHDRLADMQDTKGFAHDAGQLMPLAAEEDVPSTLWLPQFALLSRPGSAAAAAKRPDTARSGCSSSFPTRPSTAAAVLGTGLGLQQ